VKSKLAHPGLFLVAVLACVPDPIQPSSPVVRDPNAPSNPSNPSDDPMDTKKPVDKPAVVTSLVITPAEVSLAAGESVTLTASATYDDDTIADVTADVTWGVSDGALGVFDAAPGMFRATAEGVATISATHPSASASIVVPITPPVLTSLRLDTTAPSPVVLGKGETLQLEVVGVYGDGTEESLTDVVAYGATTTAVTVDARGLVTAVGLGPATVVATHESLEATLDLEVQCAYPPGAPTSIRNGQMVPNLSWSTVYDASGNEVEFDLESAYCGAPGFEGVKSIVFVIGAGWCPYCPDYMRNVNNRFADIEAAGGMVVYVEIEDSGRRPAGSDYALDHINDIIGAGPGLRVGDGDTNPSRAIGRASFVTSLPNQFVVRTSDMSVIDTGQTSMTNLLRLIDL
jgi:hypothetical protein